MKFSSGLCFLIFIVTIELGASLVCYQCNDTSVTTTDLKPPTDCARMDVNHTYCTMTIVFADNAQGYIQINSETAHKKYHYDEDFALLGLTIRSNQSLVYGVTYHCLTDGCNEPKIDKIQLLFDSTIIEHNITKILSLLYTKTPDNPVICWNYTNATDPNKCREEDERNAGCSKCFTIIDGINNAVCANCSEDTEQTFDVLDDERAYLLKTRTTKNHHYEVYCNIRECNTMDNIQQVQKLHRYVFDYDKFLGKSISSLLFVNKNIIYFHLIILFIWNVL
jgi:hypothetical protein